MLLDIYLIITINFINIKRAKLHMLVGLLIMN
jgi:hypothetical protein